MQDTPHSSRGWPSPEVIVSRLRNLDIKCDDMRALVTRPEDHDGSGIETEEEPQNQKELQGCLVP